MRVLMSAILAAALPLAAAVQVPRDAGRQATPVTGTGAIRGRVTDRETGIAIPHIWVTLSAGQPAPAAGSGPSSRQAQTDADGRYAFESLPAGSYTLSFGAAEFKVTYLPQVYGATRPTDMFRPAMPRPLALADGQVVDGADIALWRSLAITGRVVDELGDALTGVPIAVTYADGGPRAPSRGPYQTVSDDRGSFRVFGLPPGRYVVCGTPPQFGETRDVAPDRYVETCAPSALIRAEGQVVELANGDYGDVEIRMQRGRGYRVTGTARDSQGAPVSQVSVVRTEGGGFSSFGALVDGTGHFTASGLAPGDYAVRAEVASRPDQSETREREVGYLPVHIESSDVDGLAITTSRGASVTGRIVFEAASPATSGIRVTLRMSGPGMAVAMSAPPSATLKPDLTFSLSGIFAAHAVDVSGLPRGWIVRSIRLGDRDITDQVAEFRNNERLEIAVSNRGATLAGRVAGAPGSSAADYHVVLFSADRVRWTGATPTGTVPNADGTFTIGPVRAGDYLVALVGPDDLSLLDGTTAVYERLARIAQPVTLGDDEHKQIELSAGR